MERWKNQSLPAIIWKTIVCDFGCTYPWCYSTLHNKWLQSVSPTTKRISSKFQKTKTKLKYIYLFSNSNSIGLSLVAVKVKYVFGLLESKLKLWRHLWKSIEVVYGRFKWSTTMIKQWVQVLMVPVLSGI